MTKACFTLVQINLGTGAAPTPKVFQDYLILDGAGNYFYPPLTLTAGGDTGITFGASRSGKVLYF
jgi:hypothetical protein